MAYFLFFLTVTMTYSFASAGCDYYHIQDINSHACPEARMIKKGNGYDNYIVCGDLATDEIMKANVDSTYKLSSADFFTATGEYTLDAVDLGVTPDDSTSKEYSYIRALKLGGETVGYIDYAGYSNTESENFSKFQTVYNLKGRIAAIYCE